MVWICDYTKNFLLYTQILKIFVYCYRKIFSRHKMIVSIGSLLEIVFSYCLCYPRNGSNRFLSRRKKALICQP